MSLRTLPNAPQSLPGSPHTPHEVFPEVSHPRPDSLLGVHLGQDLGVAESTPGLNRWPQRWRTSVAFTLFGHGYPRAASAGNKSVGLGEAHGSLSG